MLSRLANAGEAEPLPQQERPGILLEEDKGAVSPLLGAGPLLGWGPRAVAMAEEGKTRRRRMSTGMMESVATINGNIRGLPAHSTNSTPCGL